MESKQVSVKSSLGLYPAYFLRPSPIQKNIQRFLPVPVYPPIRCLYPSCANPRGPWTPFHSDKVGANTIAARLSEGIPCG